MPADVKKNEYEDIATFSESLEGGDNVVSVISARKFGGVTRFSFSVMKEFPKSGGREMARSHWLDRRHITAMRRLLDETEKKLAEVERK